MRRNGYRPTTPTRSRCTRTSSPPHSSTRDVSYVARPPARRKPSHPTRHEHLAAASAAAPAGLTADDDAVTMMIGVMVMVMLVVVLVVMLVLVLMW